MRILITWAAIVSLSLAPRAKAQVDAFFRGAHLGMTIDQCNAYYFPHGGPTGPVGTFGAALDGPTPAPGRAIADAGSCWHSGAPKGEEEVDFRTQVRVDDDTAPLERRVVVIYRTSDHKIVSVSYWNLNGDHFSKQDLKKLLDLNRGRGISHLVSHLYDDEEFKVTTAEQYKLEQENIRALNDQAGAPSKPPDFNDWTTESLKVIFVRKIAITRVHGRIKTVTFSPGPMDGGYPTEFHAYDGFYLLGEFLRGPHADFTSDYTMYSGRDNAGHIIQTDSETPYTVTRDDYVPPAKWRYHFTVTKTGIPDIPILTAEVIPSERLGPQIILHISDPAN